MPKGRAVYRRVSCISFPSSFPSDLDFFGASIFSTISCEKEIRCESDDPNDHFDMMEYYYNESKNLNCLNRVVVCNVCDPLLPLV